MRSIHKFASFIRWRFVPVRYLTMLSDLKWNKLLKSTPFLSAKAAEIDANGLSNGPDLTPKQLQDVVDIYAPRVKGVVPKASGHPFENLFKSEDISEKNPVLRFAFSPEVLDTAADYFHGRLILDSIQVLYSYPTEGAPRESQYWHLDYGDRKTLHCVTYLNDVETTEFGPFVYIDKPESEKIGRGMIVRRIPDDQFERELKGGKVQQFYAKAGTSVLVDPSACYHYGSRCKVPRLAIFVTFSTWFPYVQPVAVVSRNSEKIYQAARLVRPDLSEAFLKSLLQLQ